MPASASAGATSATSKTDFAPTWLDYAGIEVPQCMQGRSFRAVLEGNTPSDWRRGMYYRYRMHNDPSHNTTAHYGIRTHRHKMICYYGDPCGQPGANGPATPPEWELFDLEADPFELNNIYHDPAQQETVRRLTAELEAMQAGFP